MITKRRARLPGAGLFLFILSAFSSASGASASGPQDLGFENDCLFDLACPWSVVGNQTDRAYTAVVGTEGSEYLVYERQNVRVEPYRGTSMVRLGLPQQGNEKTVRDTFAVAQTFSPATDTLNVVAWFFSYEHRGDDFYAVRVSGGDVSGVRFLDQDGNPFSITMPDGSAVSCQGGPGECVLPVNTGRSNNFLNTGWRKLTIAGLPTGSPVTLRYELTNGQNDATGSWFYVDNSNEPPMAGFTCAPNSDSPNINQEGDLTFCDARTASTDPDGDTLTYRWTYGGAGYTTQRQASGPILAAIFPKDGTAEISLTVSDGSLSDTSGPYLITVSNHVPVVGVVDIDTQPGGQATAICRFLDYGTYDQHTVSFSIGNLSGGSGTDGFDFVEENDPALSSGTARFTFDADDLGGEGTYSGSCSVSDGSGTAVAPFTVAVSARSESDWAALEALDARPTEGTLTWPARTSRVVRMDETAGGFEDTGDAFRLLRHDGSALVGGDEVLLRLSQPADGRDLDLVLLLEYPEGFADLPAQDLPAQDLAWKTAPAQDLPAQDLPAQDLPAQDLPAQDLPAQDLTYLSSVYQSVPAQDLAFADLSFLASPAQDLGVTLPPTSPIAGLGLGYYNYPLRDVASYDYDVASNAHLGFSETGGLSLDIDRKKVVPVALSANPEGDDSIWYPVPDGVKNVYALVVPSAQLQVGDSAIETQVSYEARERPPASARLPLDLCEVPQLADLGSGSSSIQRLSYGVQDTGKTAVFLQKERMKATWFADAEDPEAAFHDFMSSLSTDYFLHETVQAEVYSLPLGLWQALEPAGKTGRENVCDLQARLTLVEGIRQAILGVIGDGGDPPVSPRPGLEHVVLLGDTDSLDSAIVKDLAVVGNERNYRFDANVKINAPLSIILADGYLSTENCYVDFQRQVVAGEPYCSPDVPVARWSGVPEVIVEEAATYSQLGGILPSANALGMGYDFFAQSTADALAASDIGNAECFTDQNLGNCSTELWNGDRSREELLGQCEGCEVHDFNVFNGHAAHWAVVPPAEYFSKDFSTVLQASEIGNLLDGKSLISLGCHFRLSVPATQVENQGGLLGAREDFCDQAGPIIGHSAFGIGDTDFSNKLSELMIQLTVDNLANGDTLGQAVRQAILEYGLRNVPFTEHDAHVAMTWGVDGPPQYRLARTEQAFLSQMLVGVAQPDAGSCAADGDLYLELVETDGVTETQSLYSYGIERCYIQDRGDYWTYDWNSQGSLFLPEFPTATPIQARAIDSADNPVADRTHIHSATLLSGTFHDYVDPVIDPVFDANITDWARSGLEAQPCIEALVPVQPGVVKSLDTAGQTLQSVSFVGGAFRCTETVIVDGREQTRGVMRIFDSAQVELAHPFATGGYEDAGKGSPSERDRDFFSPQFRKLEFRRDTVTGEVVATVFAEDESGIEEYRILIFYSQAGGGPGWVEHVSTRDQGLPTPLIGEQELVLPDPAVAEAQGYLVRYGVLAVDGAGMYATKFKKGAKYLAPIPVKVISRFFNTDGETEIETVISGYDQLALPLDFRIFVNDELIGTPIQLTESDLVCLQGGFTGSDPCTEVLYRTSLELTDATPPLSVRVEVRDAANGFGFDELSLSACVDEDSVEVPPAGDFRACQASVDGTIVTVDLITESGTDPEYQYRWIFDGLEGSPQFKIWNIDGKGRTKTSSPSGVEVLELRRIAPSVLRVRFDGAILGVQPGVLPAFSGYVQSGVEQEPGQGFLDEIRPFSQ